MPRVVRITYYRAGGAWCYAAWDADGFDHSDTLDAQTAHAAREQITRLFPNVTQERVDDV